MATKRRPDILIPQPTSPVPVKPQLNIEEWEAKAPLGEAALRSVAKLKALSEHRPFPLRVRVIRQ